MRALVAALVCVTVMQAGAAESPTSRDTAIPGAASIDLKTRPDWLLPIRVAKEDWNGARRLVGADESWRSWSRSVQVGLDEWIATAHDREEWVAGYPHDLIDVGTGMPLRWSVQMPEPDLGAPATRQRKLHEAWAAYVRAYNLDRIQEASRIFRLTGDKRYADWAAQQLDFYARNYAGWPLQQFYGSRSRMLGQGLDEATASTRLIDAVRLLGDTVAPDRRARWRDRLFAPVVENLRNAKVGVNNISLWHAVAMAVIGMEFGDTALVHEALDGPIGVRAVMRTGLTADYIWYEGSLGYQTYVLRALAPLFTQASLHGQAAGLQVEMLQAQKMLWAPLQLRFDDGMLPNPGDTTIRLKAVDRDFLLEVNRVLPSAMGMAEASRRRNWSTLLDPVAGLGVTGAEALPEVRSVNLESIRMSVIKSQGWQVFFRYGQVTPHHSHEDALNYEAYFGDTPISTDAGTVLYGSSLHEDYFRRSISHNVALVDGIGQNGWDPGELERFDATAATARASQPRFRPDAAVRREIRIDGGDLVDRISTQMNPSTAAPKRLGFLFHTDCELVLDDLAAGAQQAVPPVGRGFGFWEQVTVRNVAAATSGRLRCGAREFLANWRWSTPGRLYVAQAPSTPLPRKRTVVYFESVGREAVVDLRLHPVAAAQAAR